ncbi:MAG: ABC transporter substrate-binding protein [Parasporobacterium sp.]|nr:ABC transporter substrate-binding protein [Parasporobacterium sp.]
MKKALVIVLACALIVSFCAGAAAVMAAEDSGMKKVTVILDYIPNTNHSGMYVALNKGYYAEEGLDVEIIEPTEGATNSLIANGVGTFGIAYQEDVTLALAADDPLPLMTVATLIQHNTSGFVTLADSGIETPADWEGKTYAGWGGPGENAVIRSVMEQAGADPDKLNLVIADGLGFESLGRACDIMWFFEAWDKVAAEMAGVELHYIPCNELDERLDYYTPVIVANTKTLEEDPEMVRAFLRATQKGYEDCIADPDSAAEILHQYAPDYDAEMLRISQEILADKYIADASAWGVMKDEVWDNYTEFMVEYGILEEAIPADTCYTNAFLPDAE